MRRGDSLGLTSVLAAVMVRGEGPQFSITGIGPSNMHKSGSHAGAPTLIEVTTFITLLMSRCLPLVMAVAPCLAAAPLGPFICLVIL